MFFQWLFHSPILTVFDTGASQCYTQSEAFVTVKQDKYIYTGLINYSEKLKTNNHITTDAKAVDFLKEFIVSNS